MRILSTVAVPSLLLVVVLTGCRVRNHKDGNNSNVDIGTPFGSMQVKTNDEANLAGMGITPYPGAVVVKKSKDGHDDGGAADVNMSFGNFHLGVKAVSYTTSDSPTQVLAFYKKDLDRYGSVLQCDGKHSVGDMTRTPEGLTCDDNGGKGNHLSWDSDDGNKMELRTGSKRHQHIVAVQKKDGATRISLVALDLPGGGSSNDSSDSKDSD